MIDLGRETILKINLNFQDTTNRYLLVVSEDFPPDKFESYKTDTIFDLIKYSFRYDYPEDITHIYRYEDYQRKYVSWYKKDEDFFFVQETVVSDLIPFDTTYVSFILE